MRRNQVDVWLVSNGDYWKLVWRDPASGKRRSRSIGAKAELSERQANAKRKDLELEISRSAVLADKYRLGEWLDKYIASRSDVQESTRWTYREVSLYLRAHFTDDPFISDISRAQAAEWCDAMAAGDLTDAINAAEDEAAEREERPRGRRRRKLVLSTVRKHVRAAKLIFGEAARRELLLFNPFDRLTGAPPTTAKDWAAVSLDDARRIIDACPSDGWRCLFALCRFSGVRLNEALSLRWEDVDFAANQLRVGQELESASTKKRFRICPIEPARCPTGLTRILLAAQSAAEPGGTGPCHGVSPHNLRVSALRYIRRAGLKPYAKPFHTLRKNRISEVAMEYPQHCVMEWFGHDEEVSRRFYQRLDDSLYAPPPNLDTGLDTMDTGIGREAGEATGGVLSRKPSDTKHK